MSKTIIKNIIWHDARTDKPDESGEYLIFDDYTQSIMQMNYSAFHRLWNTRDYRTREQAEKTAIYDIAYWAELPELPEGGKEKEDE